MSRLRVIRRRWERDALDERDLKGTRRPPVVDPKDIAAMGAAVADERARKHRLLAILKMVIAKHLCNCHDCKRAKEVIDLEDQA